MNTAVTLSRTEKRRIEFKRRIIDAALKCFDRNGITNTSVASIIKEADIAHKTFFNHFPTKDHLLEFLVRGTLRSAFGNFEFSEEKASPQQQIRDSFLKIAASMAAMDDGVKEIVSYYFIGIEGPREIRHEHTGSFKRYVRRILLQANKEGILRRGHSVDDLTDVVVGLYSSTVMNWISHDDYPLTKKMESVIRFIDDTVFVQ